MKKLHSPMWLESLQSNAQRNRHARNARARRLFFVLIVLLGAVLWAVWRFRDHWLPL